MIRSTALILAVLLSQPGPREAAASGPSTPTPGAARIIGTGDAGCIAGAVRLPDTAPGMQTIRISRSTFWGHPAIIASLQDIALRARAAGLPDLYMNDISDPRGGPMAGIHASHQRGLDADIWLDVAGPHPVLPLEARERLEPPSLVRPDGRAIEPRLWRPEHITLLKIAATQPGVDRVLVNAAIKRQLCLSVTGDRGWLQRVRPWFGHASHMHLHYACPAGQPECVDQSPVTPGDGCDASLQWWFDRLDAPAKPQLPGPPPKLTALPPACRAIMAQP